MRTIKVNSQPKMKQSITFSARISLITNDVQAESKAGKVPLPS